MFTDTGNGVILHVYECLQDSRILWAASEHEGREQQMNHHKASTRTVTFFLIYSLVVVFTGLGTPVSVRSQVPSAAQPGNGIIDVKGSVTINGIDAVDGAVVFSDSRIEAGANSSAAISFPGKALVDLGCNSVIRVSFGSNTVDVTVISGYARLTTYRGTTGTLMWSGGKPQKTDPTASNSSVDSGVDNVCGPIGEVPGPGGLWGLGSLGTALLLGGVGAGIIAIAVAAKGPRCDQLPSQAVSNVRPCN